MSGEAEKEILKILETSLKREYDAEKLYLRGSELSVRPEVKDLFTRLAAEEAKHAELIKELYRDTKKRLGLKILHEDERED